MANSKLTVPANLNDDLSLRRLLSGIVMELDKITGARGDDAYLKASKGPELDDSIRSLRLTIESLQKLIAAVEKEQDNFAEVAEALSDKLDAFSNITTYELASSLMKDLENNQWSVSEGLFQMSELGEDILNPPFALSTGVTYNVFASCYTTVNKGVVQEFVFENTTTETIVAYKRAGDTFSTAVNNGWINV